MMNLYEIPKLDERPDNLEEKLAIKKIPNVEESSNTINWNEWVSATSIRNYLIKDPLLDWLKQYGKTFGYTEDIPENKSSFYQLLQTKGIQFENLVIAYLYKKYAGRIITIADQHTKIQSRQLDKVEETISAMKEGKEIIVQAVLHNTQNKTYGIADLLVRSDFLNEMFEEAPLSKYEESIGCKFNKNWHYVVIDIKHITLNLKADGVHLLNTGSVCAFKGQLFIYNEALSLVQGYEPSAAFILGRKWNYTTKGEKYTGNHWFEKLGAVDFKNTDADIYIKTKEAINWIRDLRIDGHTWSINPPSRLELYPNMCNDSDEPWHTTKKIIADQLGEITSVWQCNQTHRKNAHDANITSWRNPKCSAQILGINGPVMGPSVDAILSINRSKSKILPRKITSKLPNSKVSIYLDFETVNDLMESDNYNSEISPYTTSNSYVYMIGIGWTVNDAPTWNYRCLISNIIDADNEKEIFLQLHDTLLEIIEENNAFEDITVYHWSNAEKTIYDSTSQKYIADLVQYEKILSWQWFDLCALFTKEPIVVNGALNFSLKSIAPAMYNHGFIKTIWAEGGIHNGLNAMVKAIECSNEAKIKKVSMVTLFNMKKIIEYNEVDCKVMMEIHNYIMTNMIPTNSEVSKTCTKRKALRPIRSKITKKIRC
jgi:hypothetical protein